MPRKYKVHSFRGLLASNADEEIHLERENLNLAYRIIKLELFSQAPGAGNQNSVVQVFREDPGSNLGTVDFSDPDLLGAGQWKESSGVAYPVSTPVVFDNIIFSRNIFVTHLDVEGGNDSCNYYIELEEVPVSASTLMQIKLGTARRNIGGSMGA